MDILHTIYPVSRDPPWTFYWPPPPCSCPRSYWMTPYVSRENMIRKVYFNENEWICKVLELQISKMTWKLQFNLHLFFSHFIISIRVGTWMFPRQSFYSLNFQFFAKGFPFWIVSLKRYKIHFFFKVAKKEGVSIPILSGGNTYDC